VTRRLDEFPGRSAVFYESAVTAIAQRLTESLNGIGLIGVLAGPLAGLALAGRGRLDGRAAGRGGGARPYTDIAALAGAMICASLGYGAVKPGIAEHP